MSDPNLKFLTILTSFWIGSLLLALVVPKVAKYAGTLAGENAWRLLPTHNPPKRGLIWGAGMAGQMAYLIVKLDGKYPANPVGFMDDDRSKWGTRLHGLPVFQGGVDKLEDIIGQHSISMVYVAMSRPDRSRLEHVEKVCQELHVDLRHLEVGFYKKPRLRAESIEEAGL